MWRAERREEGDGLAVTIVRRTRDSSIERTRGFSEIDREINQERIFVVRLAQSAQLSAIPIYTDQFKTRQKSHSVGVFNV